MNRLDRLTLVAAVLVFGATPAVVALVTGRFGPAVLGYYLVAGLLAAGVAALWPIFARAKRQRHRRNALGDLPPLGHPEQSPRDTELLQRYPDQEEVLAVIQKAIETGNPVVFRYRKDDGSNEQRIATPRYVHEQGRSSHRAQSLCLNAYYSKSRRNENFSVARMSGVELVDHDS